MRHNFLCAIVLLIITGSANAQQVELTLQASKRLDPGKKLRLFPKAEKKIDADAAPLYAKAAQSLPGDLNEAQIRLWIKTPLDKLPRNEIQPILKQLKPVFQLIEKAAGCKLCNWPGGAFDIMPVDAKKYRLLAYCLALKARFEIAQGRYDQAANTIGATLAAAKNMGESPILTQGLVAVGIGSSMLKQVEAFIQAPSSPNLREALDTLPKPLVDVNKPIAAEISELNEMPELNIATRKLIGRQLKSTHDLARLLMKRLDRHVAALQCIEALRLYAGSNQGNFPDTLADITQAQLPNDPVTKKPFVYSLTGSEAVLKGPAPKGTSAKEAIEYKLKFKK